MSFFFWTNSKPNSLQKYNHKGYYFGNDKILLTISHVLKMADSVTKMLFRRIQSNGKIKRKITYLHLSGLKHFVITVILQCASGIAECRIS